MKMKTENKFEIVFEMVFPGGWIVNPFYCE
uniref:Uncharacterized protein n=1 Tax=Salmonella phage vB_SEnST11_KE23 TaxID=3161174 RepID=A0AAU8GEQ9_9CAUD